MKQYRLQLFANDLEEDGVAGKRAEHAKPAIDVGGWFVQVTRILNST